MDAKDRVKAVLAAGFRDITPEDMILKRHILNILIAVFERFGFEPFDSSTVQYLSTLFGAEEKTDMQFFKVENTFHPEEGERPKLGLRFDLTVALGRFVAAYYEKLPRPFMRYQIAQVFRGETPSATRFCEFTQCDVDSVFAPGMMSDAQIIALMDECMRALGINTHLVLLNNRKILDGLPEYVKFPARYLQAVLTVLDKKDKLKPEETLEGELAKIEREDYAILLNEAQIVKLVEFCNITGSNVERFAAIRTILAGSAVAEQGCCELEEIMRYLDLFGVEKSRILIEPSMVRGLGYYTGPIFETILTDSPETGSIFSGGRYDNLTDRFVEMPAPATGASFGIDRFMVYAKKKGLFTLPKSVAQVLVAYRPSAGCRERAIEVAQGFRLTARNVMLYDGAESGLREQLGRANMLGIPFVVIIGESELANGTVTLKDMTTGKQGPITVDWNIEKLSQGK
ncbi:MAG: Histidyl-tRNA synthetase [Parcubacteria group bacterium GW2011_GWA2_40_23]|nr:MAG: Histidyl-tRNA synthetase [Parcubacteria group bacterium GW2011_GWA2_40_23]